MQKSYNKKSIMQLAWTIFKDIACSFSEALKRAWKFIKVRYAAMTRVVNVSFIKKDNTVRIANCTTNMETIPTEFHPKSKYETLINLVRVFDVDKQGWIQFNANNICL
jgi:hypothetical protein